MPKAKSEVSYTKAKREYNKENYDIITLFVEKGFKDTVKEHAAKKKMSVNRYVIKAINQMLELDDLFE